MRKTTIIILAVLSLTVSIFAWYPDSEIMCHVVTESMPADAVYVDMLIPIPETDEEYTGFNDSNGEKFGISHDSHIVQYNNGGFYSYTFHVTNAHSEIKPFDTGDGWYYVRFLDSYYDSFDDFRKEYRRAKFAYLDASGKVIATTNEIDIWQDSESVNMQITVFGEKATCEISTNKVVFFCNRPVH